jgi:phosphonate transport system permease protein
MKVLKTQTKIKIFLISFFVIFLLVISGITVEFDLLSLILGMPRLFDFLTSLIKPDLSYISVIFKKLIETLQMAIIGTTISAAISIPFSFLVAGNINANKFFYLSLKTLLNFIRTIPDVVLASIFVSMFGIGIFPGVLSVIFFSFGMMAKLMSEDLEAIDRNQVEGVISVGANMVQVICFSVIPQIIPNFISYILYTFEVNVRVSVILGLVGAGGIGQILIEDIRLGLYPKVSMIILITFITVLIIDFISEKTRAKLV